MIPNSPTWSALTDIGSYPANNLERPQPPALISDVSLGPLLISSSQSKLNTRYWSVYQVAGDVMLTGSVNGQWDTPSALFQEAEAIKDIGLTFDQLGRAMVFYRTGTDTLKLFWYDPVLGSQTIATLTTGSSLESGFDIINNTSDPDSDAMLFYTRDNVICMRIQRDRFAIEHPESIDIGDGVTSVTGLELVSSGMRVDNRFQVVYRYMASDYTPPTPDAPVIEQPELIDPSDYNAAPNGYFWAYKLTGYGSGIDFRHNIWFNPKENDLKVDFYIEQVDLTQKEIVLFSQCNATHSVSPGSSQGKYGAQLLVTVSGDNHNILNVIVGGYLSSFQLNHKLQKGGWTFIFRQTLDKPQLAVGFTPPKNPATYMQTFFHNVGTSQESSASFVFGCDGSVAPKNSFRGIMINMKVDNNNDSSLVTCTGMDKSVSIGELLPVYSEYTENNIVQAYLAKIKDYRPENWITIRSNI
ncbi:hypothetical protein [Shewanella sp. T24-MNA-CIBAN-0130]|uniref:hypothetical protein n=1 Tax=Shewanella sp. T24-MNA-CIBAN-0130 TaxID=3140470 RepID=UPI00331DAC26